ncbi:helix-turn-helix domain-containing protein, partial [Oceanihabitans sp.]|nr:helix-turn-helix domain-containing protein [Oceanihabitans sp.]
LSSRKYSYCDDYKVRVFSNLSILKSGKANALRFSTLEAICKALDCQPSDILAYVEE